MNDIPLGFRVFTVGSDYYCYIPIPKVACTYMGQAIPGHAFDVWNWRWYHSDETPPMKSKMKYLVLLRNPIERWITGVVEYWYARPPDRDWNLHDLVDIFNQIDFDTHTKPQVDFLTMIDSSRTIWLWMTHQIEKISWFQEKGVMLNAVPARARNENIFRGQLYFSREGNIVDRSTPGSIRGIHSEVIKKNITKQIKTNKQYLAKIARYYQKDFDLINSVKFHNNDDFRRFHVDYQD